MRLFISFSLTYTTIESISLCKHTVKLFLKLIILTSFTFISKSPSKSKGLFLWERGLKSFSPYSFVSAFSIHSSNKWYKQLLQQQPLQKGGIESTQVEEVLNANLGPSASYSYGVQLPALLFLRVFNQQIHINNINNRSLRIALIINDFIILPTNNIHKNSAVGKRKIGISFSFFLSIPLFLNFISPQVLFLKA